MEFADDNFKYVENCRKISKWIENSVGKGEISRSDSFSFFHSVFKRLVLQTCKKPGHVWERVETVYDLYTYQGSRSTLQQTDQIEATYTYRAIRQRIFTNKLYGLIFIYTSKKKKSHYNYANYVSDKRDKEKKVEFWIASFR